MKKERLPKPCKKCECRFIPTSRFNLVCNNCRYINIKARRGKNYQNGL